MKLPIFDGASDEAFWEVVERCLVEFFRYKEQTARKTVIDFRTRLDEKLMQPEIVYHDEPLNVASDLAGELVEINKLNISRYEKILQEVA